MTKRTTLLGALLLAGLPLTAALAQRGVGIGTANPQAQLHLESNGASQPLLLLRNAQGGPGTVVNLDFQTYDPGPNASGARLQAVDNNYSADLLFSTKQPGALANPLVERLRLTSDGRLGVGTVPDASAVLDLAATNRGVLLPRLAEQARLGIVSPAPGLLVFQPDGTQPGFWYNGGTAAAPSWVHLSDQDPPVLPWVQGSGTLYPRALASRVGIGTAAPDAAAALDITSTSQGVLLPRFGYAGRAALGSSSPLGLMFFNTDTNQLNVYLGADSGGWQALATTDASALRYTAPGLHTYTVPSGVSSVHLEVAGAQGGGTEGGYGAILQGDLVVRPGQVLYLLVGGTSGLNGDPRLTRSGGLVSDNQGNPAPYAGNGGGASEVRVGRQGSAVPTADEAVLVAGGGGGSGSSFNTSRYPNANSAIAGGRATGTNGTNGDADITPNSNSNAVGGGGATVTSGGRAGTGQGSAVGAPRQGGNATVYDSRRRVSGGGGGGGFFGGGSGGVVVENSTSISFRYLASGGGGGSSFIASGPSVGLTNTTADTGNTGNGYIVVTPNP
jgi:hypothetical protein